MYEQELTWGIAIRVWWSFMWRALLFGFLLGAVAGFIVGFAGGFLGLSKEQVILYSQILGAIMGCIAGVMVMKHVLNKRFKKFRVAILQTQ